MFFELMQKAIAEWQYATIAKALKMSVEEFRQRMFMESLTLDECLLVVRVSRSPDLLFYVLRSMDDTFEHEHYRMPRREDRVERRLN